jgi:hypothetical protein
MPSPTSGGWEFDSGLCDLLSGVSDLVDRVTGIGGGHWERSFGGPGTGWGGGAGAWTGWWPGAPGAQRGGKAGRGDVRAAILALLKEGPRTGYQIMADIKERSAGSWRPSPGAVYPALSALADDAGYPVNQVAYAAQEIAEPAVEFPAA